MEQTFKVPIRNLFCMLSYINEMPEFVDELTAIDEELITYDFLARQFIKEVEQLNRRGLLKSYVTRKEHTNRLGGRILVNESLPYIMSRTPLMVCEKDQYVKDILLNQVMKATLIGIIRNRLIVEDVRETSYMWVEQLFDVEDIVLTRELFLRVKFNRHNVHYKRMIHIARLLHELALLSHKQGSWNLFTAEIDEKTFNQVFEKFLLNFYKLEQKEYHVASEKIQWKLEGNTALLPSMRTDISLTHKIESKKIIIDAKYYKNVFQQHFGKSSFHSHNMYQLFTYLMHQEIDDLRGILIYPYNGTNVNESYRWNARISMEVMTLNLDETWINIHEGLIEQVRRR